jgi:NAD(P)-dependent dehydrogenase (short-subunit alcohol dehydrogenase family)
MIEEVTMKKLEGKVFLAFGGASGMAEATVRQFAAEGAKVVIADISEAAAAKIAAEINQAGGKAAHVPANVMAEDDIKAALQFTADTYGKTDIMLYQPGKNAVCKIVDLATETWEEVIRLNLTGAFIALREAAKSMQKTGGGVILLTSSLNSTVPCNRFAAYCSTKAGVDMLVRVAALELGPQIRVCSINPGFMNTPQIAPFTGSKPIMDLVMANHSTDRIGQPEDFAKLALFLASDDAGYITGANFVMDGGLRNFGYPDIIEIHLENKRKLAEAAAAAKTQG